MGFFDLPWPTDVRRGADGFIDVRDFPNPRGPTSTLGAYLEALSTRLTGYGTNGGAYLRFSDSVDPLSLPEDAAASMTPEASVFILDLEDGTRHPATVTYQDTETIYWAAHSVAVRPVWGRPLRPARSYAVVVTRGVRPPLGEFLRDDDLVALVDGGGDATVEAARAVYGPALDAIEAAGTPRDDVLSLAVFTTQDPTAELAAIRDWMLDEYPMPVAPDMTWRWIPPEPGENFQACEGRYNSPIFQNGVSPYEEVGSGEIVVEDGVPVVAGEYEARFMLTVPNTPMPPDGYPIVLYAHGTYGDYETFVQNGVAGLLAEAGYAVIGIDQVLHGERNPTMFSEDVLFFNFLNPMAARNNNRQAALDVVQQARFAATVDIPERIIGAVDGVPRTFDANRMYVYGHSQGGLNLPLFLAIDDTTKGGFLSGAGGLLSISVIEKTEPRPIATLVQLFLVLPGSSAEVALDMESFSYDHPVLSLLQAWIDASDGVNYGPLIFDEPREGFAPKSVMMTGGQMDTQTTANANAALAASIRAPVMQPVANRIEANRVSGIEPVSAPVTGNVAGGQATAALLQFPSDGHFVAFTNDILQARIQSFFASFADGVPTIPAADMIPPLPDAGVDAGMDAGMDGGADAGADAAMDAAADTPSDAADAGAG